MDHKRKANLFAIVSPGLERICAAELAELQIDVQDVVTGGVVFSGRLRDIYLVNLWLRTASRILVRFAEFRCRDFPDLYRKAQRMPWGSFIKPETEVTFRVTCQASRLNHTQRITETLESAVNRALGRTTNPVNKQAQLALVRIVNDQVTLSIDSSGELLHRRGYRQATTKAPLRETLAAGALMLLGWDGSEPLADPMCGSGSFPLEGALIATHSAPGLNRNFTFQIWPGYRAGLWNLLCDEAKRAERGITVKIAGSDENNDAITAARKNSVSSGFSEMISLEQNPLAGKEPQSGAGLVVCNPPYGKRLSVGKDAIAYYTELGQELKRVYPAWRKAIICPDAELADAAGLDLSKIATLDNGGLSVGLFVTT